MASKKNTFSFGVTEAKKGVQALKAQLIAERPTYDAADQALADAIIVRLDEMLAGCAALKGSGTRDDGVKAAIAVFNRVIHAVENATPRDGLGRGDWGVFKFFEDQFYRLKRELL